MKLHTMAFPVLALLLQQGCDLSGNVEQQAHQALQPYFPRVHVQMVDAARARRLRVDGPILMAITCTEGMGYEAVAGVIPVLQQNAGTES